MASWPVTASERKSRIERERENYEWRHRPIWPGPCCQISGAVSVSLEVATLGSLSLITVTVQSLSVDVVQQHVELDLPGVSNRGPSAAYQPNTLPLGQTGSLNLGSLPQSLINRMKIMWPPHITKIHIDPIFGRKAEANHNRNEDTRFRFINQYRYGIFSSEHTHPINCISLRHLPPP